MNSGMKMKIYTGIAVIAVIILISGTSILATASPATSTDPLISLSYLTRVFRPAVDTHVTSQVNSVINRVNSRATEVENRINSMATHRSQTFVVVNLNNSNTYDLPAGTEVMLRSGSATIQTGSGITALTNITTGNEQTGAMTPNNMYLAAQAGRIQATANSTVILVRGR